MVLVGNAEFLQTIELVSLDALNLETLILDALSDLAALLEVVQSVLLPHLLVDSDLVAKQTQVNQNVKFRLNPRKCSY